MKKSLKCQVKTSVLGPLLMWAMFFDAIEDVDDRDADDFLGQEGIHGGNKGNKSPASCSSFPTASHPA